MAFRRFRADADLSQIQRTPSGGLRIPANLTRVGVFTYKVGPERLTRRELRLPEEVFHPDSLASLRGATVTDDHPMEGVSPDNWKGVAIGHVADDVSQVSNYVSASLCVQDASAITKVDQKLLVECSCGYDADLDETPGVYDGEPYDGIQRNIRYNHVALGPPGWGRAGPNVRLRMDSADQEEDGEVMAIKVKQKDGSFKEYTEEELSKLLEEGAKEKARADKAEAELSKGRKDRLAALVNASRKDGEKKLDEGDVAKMSELELMIALLSTDPSFNPENTDEAYVRGCFEAYVKRQAKEAGKSAPEEKPNPSPPPPPTDSGTPVPNPLDRALDSLEGIRKGGDKPPPDGSHQTPAPGRYVDSRANMIRANAERALVKPKAKA